MHINLVVLENISKTQLQTQEILCSSGDMKFKQLKASHSFLSSSVLLAIWNCWITAVQAAHCLPLFWIQQLYGEKIHATRLTSLLNCANEVRTAQSSMEIFIWNCSKCTRESPAAGWLKTGGIAILLTHITAPANPKARPKGFVAIWLGNSYHSFHHKSSPDIHTGDYKVIKKLKNIYILKFGIRKKVI